MMSPSGSRHDDEVRGNEMNSRAAANGVPDAPVGIAPSHDGALAEAHDAPMAFHAHPDARVHANKETAVRSARQDRLVGDSSGGMLGTRVQGNGCAEGVEAKRKWMGRA